VSRTEIAGHTADAADGALVPAACTIAYPDRDLAAAAAHLADRFGAIELTFDHGVSLPPRPGLIDDLVALRREQGLRYAVHLPLTIQLASPNPALRRASLDTLVDVFARCTPLEPVAWVLHVTPLFGVERSITSRERAQAQQSRNVALADESLAALLARTGVSSRRIAVENLNYPFAILDDVLERHDLGVCFDVGHLLARGGDPAAFVRRYVARLAHVHLHDVIAGLDHRPLGDPAGALDLAALWRALGEANYRGVVTLEVFNEAHIAQSHAVARPFFATGQALSSAMADRADAAQLPELAAERGVVDIPVAHPGGEPVRFTGRVSPAPRIHYLLHEFDLAPGSTELTVTLRYHKRQLCQLFLALFDPQEYRGTRMNPGGHGDIVLELRLGAQGAGPGAVVGPLRAGRWRTMIDIERTSETADYELEIIAVAADAPAEADADGGQRMTPDEGHVPAPDTVGTATAVAAAPASTPGAGWYRGELHAHSWHSDGKVPVAQVVEAARAYGLDFLALTDHFTNAGWREAVALGNADLAILRGLELTGHAGHANLHGLGRWVNVYPDGPARDASGAAVPVQPGMERWDINAVARAAREQGGLFCVNHAFAGDLGWRYHDFDWGLADLLEIYHHLEGPHNALQLGLWDEQLRQGRRIVGVAGTDSHHPRDARHRLGQCFTYVHAPALSEAGIIAGLRSGRVYASLGPRLDFWAEATDGARVEMGEAVSPGTPLRLGVALHDLRFPAQIFLLKNGYFQETLAVDPTGSGGAREVSFTDTPEGAGYYRVEIYAANPQEPRVYRQPAALLALTNPIFVAQEGRCN
jgi:sugar phosphate isomerase/epimerase